MAKKVIIEILLVSESLDKRSDEIEGEILKEFREGFLRVPWSYEIEKIRIAETWQILERKNHGTNSFIQRKAKKETAKVNLCRFFSR